MENKTIEHSGSFPILALCLIIFVIFMGAVFFRYYIFDTKEHYPEHTPCDLLCAQKEMNSSSWINSECTCIKCDELIDNKIKYNSCEKTYFEIYEW